jgi:hypothetical protein
MVKKMVNSANCRNLSGRRLSQSFRQSLRHTACNPQHHLQRYHLLLIALSANFMSA